MDKAKVYFTRKLTSQSIVELYKKLNIELKGNLCVKVHSGEEGNQNYLRPEFLKDIIEYVNGTVVECNTAYSGYRNESKKHLDLLNRHGFSKIFKVDLMDENGPDDIIKIENGKVLKENIVGNHLKNYDSCLVLSHFKGHPMGGYGGALKQLSIGFASSNGKANIHSGGKVKTLNNLWSNTCSQDKFLESMADAAKTITDKFKDNIAYINILVNLSVDCDCCSVAEDPCMKDIGIMASIDPVAIDKASIDMIINSDDKGKEHFLERVNSRHGMYTIEVANELGIGNIEYELIDCDK